VIGWALRRVLLWCVIAVLGVGLIERSVGLWPGRSATPAPAHSATTSDEAGEPVRDTLVYPADGRGHVVIDAVIDGAPLRLLVDTGASLVTLSAADARAAGIEPDGLAYTRRAATANGTVRMAPVTLREVRIGRFAVADVPAAVIENLGTSLLGQSFLSRLKSYEMRDGKLTLGW
jgi:aspartyl protease family protein